MEEKFFGQTYILTEEMKQIQPLLHEAMNFQKTQYPEYAYPHSYWTDSYGWLYIKWGKRDDPNRLTVWRYSKRGGVLFVEQIKQNLSKIPVEFIKEIKEVRTS